MAVERGVWLSNSCAPATNSAPISPSPGKLETPPPPTLPPVGDTMPDIPPLPKALEKPRRLATPRFRDDAGREVKNTVTAQDDSVRFNAGSEGLDVQATRTLGMIAESLAGDDRSIITLNAYAAMPADNNQQEARRIALARALAVRSYLMRKGINSTRIDVRALGPAGDGKGDDRVDIKIK
jgi:outer membrane protein OmpA-like peptidoglycan-associated protein